MSDTLRMPFGKHKGERISTIPHKYLRWVRDECDDIGTWPWLKPTIQRVLDGETDDDDSTDDAFERNGNGHAHGHHRPPPTASQREHQELNQALIKRGNWLPVSRSLFRDANLSALQAFLLSHICNRGQILADPHGWIPLGERHLEDDLGMSPKSQQATLRNLEKRGLIEVRKRGDGRRARVDKKRLREELFMD